MAVAGAELLNEKWEALSDRFNLLKSVPPSEARVINSAIAGWQDFYWEKFEAWPSDELLAWQDRYVQTARVLDAAAKRTTVVKTVQQTDAYSPPKKVAVRLPPLLVTAPVPKPLPDFVEVGPVDVGGWANGTDVTGPVYSRGAIAPAWEAPVFAEKPLNRTGLWALVASVGVFAWLKRRGVL